MLRVMTVSLALILAAPAAAQAAGPTAASPATAQQQPADSGKKICKRDVSTGSIMPKRICKTAAEWAAIDRASAESRQRALSDQDNHQMMQQY